MNRSAAILTALIVLVPAVSPGESHTLEFVKAIGVGWQPERSGWMGFVSFSPDGRMVASDGPAALDDISDSLTIWSFPEGRLIKHRPVRPDAMSPDWKYCANYRGVWEIEPGKQILSIGKDEYAVHAFSPDSRYVAESIIGKDALHPHIHVVDLATGKRVCAFGKHNAFSVAYSSDGMTVASGHWDIVTLWNASTGRRLAVLQGFGRYVQAISFSKDGNWLAAGTDLGRLQIWDVHQLTRLASVDVGGGFVSKPAFSADGRLVAVGSYGTGTAWLIDAVTGQIIDKQKVSDIGCGAVAFSPDGRFLITVSTGGLIKWPYDRGGTIRVFKVNRAY